MLVGSLVCSLSLSPHFSFKETPCYALTNSETTTDRCSLLSFDSAPGKSKCWASEFSDERLMLSTVFSKCGGHRGSLHGLPEAFHSRPEEKRQASYFSPLTYQLSIPQTLCTHILPFNFSRHLNSWRWMFS